MRLPTISLRVKDAPVASAARATGGGARAFCTTGSFTTNEGQGTTNTVQVVATSPKTYVFQWSFQYHNPFVPVPTNSHMSSQLSIDSTSVSPASAPPDYFFDWDFVDITTSQDGDRATSSVSAVQSLAAGTHDFFVTVEDTTTGTITYSLVIIETDFTGDGCFTLNV